jgi:hypothetical protein
MPGEDLLGVRQVVRLVGRRPLDPGGVRGAQGEERQESGRDPRGDPPVVAAV